MMHWLTDLLVETEWETENKEEGCKLAEDIVDINGDDSIEVGEFCNNVDEVWKVNILSSHNYDENDNDDGRDDS